jgi:Coenzyme F420-reducing hydrogenase, beta subunit
MNQKQSVYDIVKNNLCTGCGICEDICPTKSIQMRIENGEWRPFVKTTTCMSHKGCKKCLKVCPGVGCNLAERSGSLFSESKNKDEYLEKYIACFTGYSEDESIRFHSASGGMLSQFLIYLLDRKIIDGAVVTGFSTGDKTIPHSFIARTKEEILCARSSKYCPVMLNEVGNEICSTEGKYIVVGLPCHIQGFRKRADVDRIFNERVLGYLAIYCSSNRNFYAQDFLLKKYNVNRKDVVYFAYRDEGCLGNMIIERKQEKDYSHASRTKNTQLNSNSRITIPYTDYYHRLRSFFKPRRCLSCIDHYGMLADVSFGDIHVKPYSDDKIGVNSLVVRNLYFHELLLEAEQDGYIKLNPLDAVTLNESQKEMLYAKRRKVKALMNVDKLRGRAVPDYDLTCNERPVIMDYISMVSIGVQRFIGRHPALWLFVDFSNKGK